MIHPDKTRCVVILKWEGGLKSGNPVLFLPEYDANMGRIVCYAHMGQHSEADICYYAGLKNCRTPEQKKAAAELLEEYRQRLEPDEYIDIVKRDTDRFRAARYGWMKRREP